MEVGIKSCTIIKPSEPTWEGVFPLTEWDQVGTITHVPTVYFYKPSKDWLTSPNSIVDSLKESLSRALVYFYPLAGRVRWIGQGRLELNCNGKGVKFLEAESNTMLSDLGDFTSHTCQFKSLVPLVDFEQPINEIPLMLAQLTKFGCGGICLGVAMSHIIADGESALQFMMDWAKLDRGEPLVDLPYLDRHVLRAKEPLNFSTPQEVSPVFDCPPLLIGKQDTLEERNKETNVFGMPLTKEFVDNLKKVANMEVNVDKIRPYSRYEAITANIWRSACKARNLQNEQPTGVGFSVSVRRRLDPPLPPRFFGNAILEDVAFGRAGDIITKPLSYTCGRIREVIEKVNNEKIWSNINFLKSLPDLSIYQDLIGLKSEDGSFYGNPNLGVTSWLTLPIYGLDFGWGKEIYMGPGNHDMDGGCLVLPGPINDGSVKIVLCLQVAYVDSFKKFFYDDILREARVHKNGG